MNKERLQEIKDSVNFQREILKAHNMETLCIDEEQELIEEIERLNNVIDNAIKKLNKYRNRKDTWGLWCMEYGDNAEVIKILGGEAKNESRRLCKN